MHVVFPLATGKDILVSLRRLKEKGEESSYWSQKPEFSFLLEKAKSHQTILISGATGSGKTTLLRELISELPLHERIIALEDTPELTPNHPHFLSLLARPANPDGAGEIRLRDLLKQCLRMRPDRILLGECRGEEVMDLLLCLNTGHKGTLATLHANSNRDALRRIELLCHLASGGKITSSVLRDLISQGVQWLVHLEKTQMGREIIEVSQIAGKEGDTILLRPVVQRQSHECESSKHLSIQTQS
jgi:pilus assembly protein CpaF